LRHFRFLLLCFCLTAFFESYGQKKFVSPQDDTIKFPTVMPLQDDFVNLSGEVKVIDSQYILILKLSVFGDKEIFIDKSRYFDHGQYTIAQNRLNLLKIVRKSFVNIYTSELKQPMFIDWEMTGKVTKQHPLVDTINIANYYPLELAKYLISAYIDYSYKSAKHTASSNEMPFTVSFLPKNTEYD
jgi:hypothetical protein